MRGSIRQTQAPRVDSPVRFWARPGERFRSQLQRSLGQRRSGHAHVSLARPELLASSEAPAGPGGHGADEGDAMAVIKLPSTAVFDAGGPVSRFRAPDAGRRGRSARSRSWPLRRGLAPTCSSPRASKPGDVVVSAPAPTMLQPGQAVKLYQAPQAA